MRRPSLRSIESAPTPWTRCHPINCMVWRVKSTIFYTDRCARESDGGFISLVSTASATNSRGARFCVERRRRVDAVDTSHAEESCPRRVADGLVKPR